MQSCLGVRPAVVVVVVVVVGGGGGNRRGTAVKGNLKVTITATQQFGVAS